MSQDLRNEIEKVKSILSELSTKYGRRVEFLLLGSIYDEDDVYDGGFESMSIANQRTFYYYREIIENAARQHRELLRFMEFARMGEFRVVCKNDNIDERKLREIEEERTHWVQKGKEYVVTHIIHNADGLTFQLRHLDGTPLDPPYPYEGYSSVRFDVADYSKLN